MIDGTIARKTGAVGKFGARLDTVADFVFMFVCWVKILPLMHIPVSLWVWIIIVALIKIFNITLGFIYKKKLSISPSLRIGYMVLPQKLVGEFDSRLGFYSCTVPTFEQYVVARLLQNGDFERHINKVRRKNRKELSQN